ncbi:MAG: aprX 2, partial [Armatimonadetes bacterium]|nr:aprX 2 [Armatimonadota bacterium]
NEPSAITVGALNTFGTPNRDDDAVCTYSSRGPTYQDGLAKPDVVAPGNRIASVRAPGSYLDTVYPGNRVQYDTSATSAEYYELSGTSMAAPQVAGIAALVLQANSSLPPNAVKGLLMYTAQRLSLHDAAGAPLPSTYSVLTQGAGSVNAVGAVELARQLNTSATVGADWLTGTVSGASTVGGGTFPWSKQVLWQNLWMRGDAVLELRQALWTEQADWGADANWSGEVTANDYWDDPPLPPPPPGDGGCTGGSTGGGGCTGGGSTGGGGTMPGDNTGGPPPPPNPGDGTQITWSDTGPIQGD